MVSDWLELVLVFAVALPVLRYAYELDNGGDK